MFTCVFNLFLNSCVYIVIRRRISRCYFDLHLLVFARCQLLTHTFNTIGEHTRHKEHTKEEKTAHRNRRIDRSCSCHQNSEKRFEK